ncbi:hypothetical protein LJK88_43785 [Paenibacillus sp. P26]|nr:hypothetical protein LJK88_43785 [Paenibacillus sp. P26]UUZ92366.1 hypothetical protein LJK87_44520 [Paenibacillus sp. P25]
MKKNIIKISVVVILFLIVVAAIYSQQQNKDLKLESITGYSLNMVFNGYDEIAKYKNEKPSLDSLNEMSLTLARIEAYSGIIDRAVNYNLLEPIAGSMFKITEDIKSNLKENKGSLTEGDKERYSMLQKEISTLVPLMYKTYYVPGSEAKASLKIPTPQEIIELKDRLNKYTVHMK